MDNLKSFTNLCRVCLRDDDENQMTHINTERYEKLHYIGDSSEIIRLDNEPIQLCIKCDIKLDLVYEYILKFNRSKAKLIEYAHLYDPYQVVDLNLEAIEGCDQDDSTDDFVNIVKVEPPYELPESPCHHAEPKHKRKRKRKRCKSINDPTSNDLVQQSEHLNGTRNEFESDTSSVCYICKKQFSTRANMLRHVREHLGRRFICEYDGCKSFFTQKSSLQVHIAPHKGLKPYDCEICGKKFSQSKSLVFHRRVHTGESPYECDYCEKKFKQKSNLIRHFKCHRKPTKPKQKRFGCPKCEKCLASKQSLLRHLTQHEREIKVEKN